MKQIFHLGHLQDLAHCNDLIVHDYGRNAHHAVFHYLCKIGDIRDLGIKPQALDRVLCVFILLVAGRTACAENLDTELTATAGADLYIRCFTCRATAAASTGKCFYLIIFLLSKKFHMEEIKEQSNYFGTAKT